MTTITIIPTEQEANSHAARAAAATDRAALPAHAAAAAQANSVPALRAQVAAGLEIQAHMADRIAALDVIVAELRSRQ